MKPLNNITPHINLSPSQRGFRSQHSTSTLPTNLTQTILEGLNEVKPAYRSLLKKILNTHIHPNFKKWLANFLSGRLSNRVYNGKSFRTLHCANGVSQGSVLSPTIFNLYMHDIPTPTQPNTHFMSYSDDFTLLSQQPKHETAATQLQDYIHTLEEWLNNNRMKVSTNKFSLTLITPHNAECRTQSQVTLNNTPLPVTQSTKILSVIFDQGMTFQLHTDEINTKAKNRLNVFRSLIHTSYRHSKGRHHIHLQTMHPHARHPHARNASTRTRKAQ